jgi:uncharacterized protein
MKKNIVILSFLFFLALTGKLSAQVNEMKARIEYEEAEKAYSENNYELALSKLTNAKKFMGSWQSRISYLEIISLDKLVDYEEWVPLHDQLKAEVALYLNFADKNSDKIDIKKVKEVYAIEQKIADLQRIKEWSEDPDVKKAEEFDAKGDFNNGMIYNKKAAERGNGNAMYTLAGYYYFGYGVPQNYTEAFKWFNRAVEKGDFQSFEIIAVMYAKGQGVTQSYTEATKWFKKSAEKGNVQSMYILGMYNCNGIAGSKNYAEGMSWMKKAAEKGKPEAMFQIGNMFWNGLGVVENPSEALIWYKKAAEKGHGQSMTIIGYLYEHGEGVSKNLTEAINWYKKGAEKGDVNAYWNLGRLYYQPEGFMLNNPDSYNRQEAFKWFKLAAEGGNKKAMEKVAWMYRNGSGYVNKDKALALEWETKLAQTKD